MDVEAIANLFATSLSADPNVRKVGEIEIRRIGNQEGVLTSLMQIIGNEGVDPAVRQACSVFLKNRIVRAWHIEANVTKVDAHPIPQSDRAFIKSHILALLVTASSRPLRVQVASALKTIITNDFPANWPTLLDEILTLLNSGDQRSIYGGCFALLELVKSMRFRIENNLMPQIAEKSFPTLVELGTNLVQNLTPENADCLHIILKTYKASTQTSLSPHQQSSQSIMTWGRLLFQVVAVQLPAGTTLPGSPDDWQNSEWWKAKKWAFNTLNRLFERYGNPSQLPASMKKEVSAFAEHFVKSFAPEIFKTYLQQVELYASGQIWLSKKVLSAILRFFSACVKPKSTWAILKPHAQSLVANVVFPTLTFDEERAELWQSDPVEFVRRTLELDDLVAPSAAGLSFLLQLATSRPKSTFMGTLSFINGVVSAPTVTPNQKFGALSMISSLGGVIMETKPLKGDMEVFVTKHVLPELQSPQGYMRHIACDVIGTFERFGMQWTTPGTLEAIYTAVARAVEDPELPVRVSAVLALMGLIQHEEVRQGLSSHIVQIMQVLFTLSDETDMDVISDAMESFITEFKDELVPASAQIVERLCQNYVRLVQEHVANAAATSGADDMASVTSASIDDDKTMAMMGLAKTIEAVVDALETVDPKPLNVLTQVQEIVIPIITLTFEKELVDLFDAMLSLVDIFTFTLRAITPSMWPVFEYIYKLFKSVAVDYLDEMLPALDNFIDFGKDVFSARPDYRGMAVDFFATAMSSEALSGDMDRINGCKIGEAILLNLRGLVDDHLPAMIATTATVFAKSTTIPALKLELLNLLINFLLYNPALSLQIMESQHSGLARSLLDQWFIALQSEHGKGLPRVHDKKLSIIALSALIEMDPAHVPPSLRDGWPGLLGGALNVFSTLQEAINKREELQTLIDADIEEDDDDEELPGDRSLNDNDDEDVWDEDDEYLQMLAAEGARLRGKREGGAEEQSSDVSDDDDPDDDDSDIEEEINVETPLDKVNPWVRFKAALTTLQNSNPAGYQAATTALKPEQQTQLMEVMATAQRDEEQAAAEGTA